MHYKKKYMYNGYVNNACLNDNKVSWKIIKFFVSSKNSNCYAVLNIGIFNNNL